eukprot:6204181-Pleurochrysis_carterae.AAC.1
MTSRPASSWDTMDEVMAEDTAAHDHVNSELVKSRHLAERAAADAASAQADGADGAVEAGSRETQEGEGVDEPSNFHAEFVRQLREQARRWARRVFDLKLASRLTVVSISLRLS